MKKIGISGKQILIVISLIAMVLLIRDFNSRMTDLRRLTLEEERVGGRVTALHTTKQALQTEIEYAQSDEAVHEYLYEQERKTLPEDIPVVLVTAENIQPTPTLFILPTAQVVSNWQLWAALFVDAP